MRSQIVLECLLSFLLLLLVRPHETKLVPEYNLKAIGDFEVIQDQYKVLYKEHLYSLKEKIEDYINQNEIVLYETYTRLFDMLNNTKIDTSGEFVSIKYKLLKQLQDNRDDLIQTYVSIRYKVSEITYKLISYIEHNLVDKQTLYVLEYTLEQVLRKMKNAIPHNKHHNVLEGMKKLPYLFLHQNYS
uniref:Interferon gamma n=1 Tax=Cacopsylla melanoneura TaxID=428564 RepID=A0A8D8YVD6_9HEMI